MGSLPPRPLAKALGCRRNGGSMESSQLLTLPLYLPAFLKLRIAIHSFCLSFLSARFPLLLSGGLRVVLQNLPHSGLNVKNKKKVLQAKFSVFKHHDLKTYGGVKVKLHAFLLQHYKVADDVTQN
jgi:hypothetical protein